ncbi:HlyD family efflux transporter periplasmic adaptor subunit [Myxococcota bacterium]|nr:HlyD family efflux transporter periplasmic adaptor subunit [Myxococcota bacterium]
MLSSTCMHVPKCTSGRSQKLQYGFVCRRVRFGFLAGIVLVATSLVGCGEGAGAQASTNDVPPGRGRSIVVAMARLEPDGRVVRVGSSTDDVILEAHVSDGEVVVEGQTLVVLMGHALREAERDAAKLALERVELTPYEIEAQNARVRSIEAELAFARDDVEDQRGLIAKGFSPGREFQEAELSVRRHEERLAEEVAALKKLEAGFDLERREAASDLRRAEAELERTIIRAPTDGRILKVLKRPGERTGAQPIVHLGRTQEMYALAEVHANDIRHVKSGQRARFESAALAAPIEGVVEEVGSMIYTNNIFGEDPGAPAGVRVFQVKIRLDEASEASRFTNLEGQARIFVDSLGSS